MPREEWDQLIQRTRGVAAQSDFARVAQGDAAGVGIDLDSPSLSRLGQKLDIRKRAATDEQRVTLFEGGLRWFGSQQADASGGVGAVVGHGGFSEERFHNRRG